MDADGVISLQCQLPQEMRAPYAKPVRRQPETFGRSSLISQTRCVHALLSFGDGGLLVLACYRKRILTNCSLYRYPS